MSNKNIHRMLKYLRLPWEVNLSNKRDVYEALYWIEHWASSLNGDTTKVEALKELKGIVRL